MGREGSTTQAYNARFANLFYNGFRTSRNLFNQNGRAVDVLYPFVALGIDDDVRLAVTGGIYHLIDFSHLARNRGMDVCRNKTRSEERRVGKECKYRRARDQ